MAQVPARSAAAKAGADCASPFTVPMPVTTMRASPPFSPRTGLLGADVLGERVDGGEGALADLLVRDRDAELLLDQHDQLERVDRIEAEPVDEDRLVVGDGRCRHV